MCINVLIMVILCFLLFRHIVGFEALVHADTRKHVHHFVLFDAEGGGGSGSGGGEGGGSGEGGGGSKQDRTVNE